MLFEAIPLLFFYLFTSVFSGAKCSIAAVSSGLPPLFHSMEFLLPAFLRTADPGLLFFQENSFCTFLIHRFYGKNSAVLRLFHPDFSFHHTVFRACRKAEVIALPRGKPADLFPQHPAALRADNICHPLLLHRLFLCLKLLQIHQLHRSPGSGVFCAFPGIMRFQTLLNIIRPPSI